MKPDKAISAAVLLKSSHRAFGYPLYQGSMRIRAERPARGVGARQRISAWDPLQAVRGAGFFGVIGLTIWSEWQAIGWIVG